MALIVTLLKKKSWVKMKTIKNALDATEFSTGAYLGCGNRTIQRDIAALKQEYSAPIIYSKCECAYSLTNRDWTFQVPALLNPDGLLAIGIGGKLSQELLPPSISGKVSLAVDEVLRYNQSELFNAELLSSLKVLSFSSVPNDLFGEIFEAWRARKILQISYADKDGNSVLRDIEPHTLVFHDMRWSIKGFCRLRQAVRTFQLNRIKAAVIKEESFQPSKEIIDSITLDSFLDYEKLSNAQLLLNEWAGRRFAVSFPLHSQQSFTLDDDGWQNFVPAISLESLTPWVLRQQGNAKPLSPVKAVETIRKSIRRLADTCQAYDTEEVKKKTKKWSRKNSGTVLQKD
ncbi:MAG: WYL domain-containing protein [Victivallis sp.]